MLNSDLRTFILNKTMNYYLARVLDALYGVARISYGKPINILSSTIIYFLWRDGT